MEIGNKKFDQTSFCPEYFSRYGKEGASMLDSMLIFNNEITGRSMFNLRYIAAQESDTYPLAYNPTYKTHTIGPTQQQIIKSVKVPIDLKNFLKPIRISSRDYDSKLMKDPLLRTQLLDYYKKIVVAYWGNLRKFQGSQSNSLLHALWINYIPDLRDEGTDPNKTHAAYTTENKLDLFLFTDPQSDMTSKFNSSYFDVFTFVYELFNQKVDGYLYQEFLKSTYDKAYFDAMPNRFKQVLKVISPKTYLAFNNFKSIIIPDILLITTEDIIIFRKFMKDYHPKFVSPETVNIYSWTFPFTSRIKRALGPINDPGFYYNVLTNECSDTPSFKDLAQTKSKKPTLPYSPRAKTIPVVTDLPKEIQHSRQERRIVDADQNKDFIVNPFDSTLGDFTIIKRRKSLSLYNRILIEF